MSNIFISISIPAYEKPGPLKRLLESIAVQSYKNYEIIITDDSKTDDVKSTVDIFSNSLPIKYLRNIPAEGMGNNWNKSITDPSGEWVKIMHDDDWFADENALQLFADAASSTREKFIFCAANIVTSPGNSSRLHRLESAASNALRSDLLSLLYHNNIGHPSVTFFKKDDSIFFDKQFRWVIDIDFYIRYLQKSGDGFLYIDAPLINITNNENQVSAGCYKNPYVEIPEYLHLLSKFETGLHLHNPFAFYCIWELVRKFKINNPAQLNQYGYHGNIPEKITSIIGYQKQIPAIILKQPPLNKWLMQYYFKQISH